MGLKMRIPDSFKKALASTFYDKAMKLCVRKVTKDSLGAVVGSGYEPILSFMGSFQPMSSNADVEEYGQGEQSLFRVACDIPRDAVRKGETFVLYGDTYYDVKGVYPTDTSVVMTVSEVTK